MYWNTIARSSQATSCSGETYGFDASRDGSSYSIRVSAADGELTEVRRR